MTTSAHNTDSQNRPQTMRFYPFTFTGNAPRKGKRIPLNEVKYNEQRDEETGYGVQIVMKSLIFVIIG